MRLVFFMKNPLMHASTGLTGPIYLQSVIRTADVSEGGGGGGLTHQFLLYPKSRQFHWKKSKNTWKNCNIAIRNVYSGPLGGMGRQNSPWFLSSRAGPTRDNCGDNLTSFVGQKIVASHILRIVMWHRSFRMLSQCRVVALKIVAGPPLVSAEFSCAILYK